MFHQTHLKTAAIVLVLAAGVLAALTGGFYTRELVAEAAVLAILAVSLDLVAGYGGMISLCHGAIFGLGAYVFAATTVLAELPPSLALAAALAATAAFGFAVGFVTSRTHGIFFIMATLAFGQMVYVYIFDKSWLGGDDGMSGVERLDFSLIGVDLGDSRIFALFTVAMLALVYAIAALILRSGFGRTLVGIRSNETRMRALGLPVWKYKASAFAISGALAGLGGALAAQHTMFVSPQMLMWMVSGEALVVVILGGLGTLAGPAVGAALFVFLKHEISRWTDHWHLVVGLVLIATVMSGGRGIYGQIEHLLERRSAKRTAKAPAAEQVIAEREHA